MAWNLSAVAQWWPDDARNVWKSFAPAETKLTSELVLFAVDPQDGNPFPRPYVYTFRSPNFEAIATTGPLEVSSIGKGRTIKTYTEPLTELWANEDLVQLETLHPGGITMGIEQTLTEKLLALPIRGISPHLHVCTTFRDRVTFKTNDRLYIGDTSPAFRMPPVVTRYEDFKALAATIGVAAVGALA
jgi:hypothetical protein